MANSNEYYRVYMLNRYHTRRAQIIDMLGGQCARCGSRDELEIDHIDAKQKGFSIGSRLSSAPMSEILAEVAKCQLLCKECHKKKSVLDCGKKPAAHGTLNMYQYHECRCEACKAANAVASRAAKARAKARRAAAK